MDTIDKIKQLEIKSSIKPSEREAIYHVVKRNRPTYAVETGSGASTVCILLALKENALGQLISIDKPDFDGARKGDGEGDKIRKLWQKLELQYPSWVIHEEDILRQLPFVVEMLPHIDFFFDDSYHTSEHVFAEWEIIVPKLRKGSVFGMHDIGGKFGGKMKEFVKMICHHPDWQQIERVRAMGFWKKIK